MQTKLARRLQHGKLSERRAKAVYDLLVSSVLMVQGIIFSKDTEKY